MFNISVLRDVLLLSCVLGIIFSIPHDHSNESISASVIFNTSPVPEDFTTKLQNVPECETFDQWAKCEAFLETHLTNGSKEYTQLLDLKSSFKRLQSNPIPLPRVAAILGHTELIQVLLRNGVPVNKKYGTTEVTLLHTGVKYGHNTLINMLLSQGADIQVKDWVGNTPLHVAVSYFQSKTTKLLLDTGASVNVTNNEGETPLFQAVSYLNNSKYIFRVFNSQLEMKNIAYAIGEIIIESLLESGADTNIPNHEGTTPLHISAKISDTTILKLLIDGGANINATDNYNKTPLHKATESNNVSVVRYLVTIGCNKTISDSDNKTALDIAEDNNFTEIVDLLSRES